MSYRQVAAGDYEQLLTAGAQVVDVRSTEEFVSGSTAEAINIPIEELYMRLTELDRNRCVIVVGATGEDRTIRAAVLLRACFFPDVAVVVGGLQALESDPSLVAA